MEIRCLSCLRDRLSLFFQSNSFPNATENIPRDTGYGIKTAFLAMLKISRGIRDIAGYKIVAIILSRYFLYRWNPMQELIISTIQRMADNASLASSTLTTTQTQTLPFWGFLFTCLLMRFFQVILPNSQGLLSQQLMILQLQQVINEAPTNKNTSATSFSL